MNGKLHDDLNAIDSETKFILSELFVEKKDLPSVKIFLLQIKKRCYTQILAKYVSEKHKPKNERKLITFVCDGCPTYGTAFNILFGQVTKLIFGIPIKYRKFGVKHNNNAIERYNKEIKRRIIVFGSFRSLEGARVFLSFRAIMHNFVNPHSELNGTTPAQAADIKIPLGENRLLDLIKYAPKQDDVK
ncbi:DDE-type integrase/transposase/recombinase [Candidatus Woesearchaeota archaeon]|nr:DDE-type integrase/transposase/recombinase [Candidatus Woesearchaeota archaeon]